MARTAPVPNIPPIPGMNPGAWVMGGGGDGGKSGGKGGKGGKGNAGASGEGGDDDGKGGGDGTGSCGQGSGGGCPNPAHGSGGRTAAGDPVDVATGRVFTAPAHDLVLPGPLPLRIVRQYSSHSRNRDVGLGFGWVHSLAWEIEERTRDLVLFRGDGSSEHIARPEPRTTIPLPPGRSIAREEWGYVFRDEHGHNRYFRQIGKRFVLYRIQSATDHRIEIEHDAAGNVTSITDSVFRVVNVRRDERGRIAAFEVRAGAQGPYVSFYGYGYDENGNLARITDAEGNVQRFGYREHLLTEHAWPDGLTVRFRYDDDARCIETWANYGTALDESLADDVPAFLADGRTQAKGVLHNRLEYGESYTEVVDSRQLKRYEFSDHNLATKACWGPHVWTNTYDEHANVVSTTDPLGAVWHYLRDERARVVYSEDPTGKGTRFDLDAWGNLVAVHDATGAVVYYEHDGRGILTGVRDALGDVVRYFYDDLGHLVEATLPNGGITRMAYDAHGNRVQIVEPDGGVRRIEYDYLGQLVRHTDPAGQVTRFRYHRSGRLASVHYASGASETFDYDSCGRVCRIKDANDRVYRLCWAGYDVVHEVVRPNGERVRFRYDREGGLVLVLNEAGEAHRYERDAAGYIRTERTFDGREFHYEYDGVGRIVRVASGKDHWIYEYDPAGRLIGREHPDGSLDAFTHDGVGRLLGARNGEVECRFELDARGAIVKESVTYAGETTAVEYENDLLGKPSAVRSSLGFHETVERNAVGAPTAIRFDDGASIGFVYDLRGQEVRRELPGGGAIESTIDSIGVLKQRKLLSAGVARRSDEPDWVGAGPAAGLQRDYGHTLGGEVRTETDPARGVTEFEHDALGQLFAVDAGGTRAVTPYDAVGNRLLPGAQYAAGGRLTRAGSTEFVYDDAGALVERREASSAAGLPSVSRYTWTGAGLLESVQRPDGVEVSFVYDAFARRIAKYVTRDGVVLASHRYVWSGDTILHEIRRFVADDGTPIVEERTFCHGPVEPIPVAQRTDRIVMGARQRGAWEFLFLGENFLPLAVVAGDGRVLAEVDPDPWAAPRGASTATPFRFLGQFADEETGLVYNRYRYYDPSTGRYISPDPLRLQGSLRGYAYVDNRPLGATDAYGLQTTTTITRTGGLPPITTSQADNQQIHPAVAQAVSPCTAHTGGAPRVQPETPTTPESGGRRPASCGEPAALSAHLFDWEGRNCPPQPRPIPGTPGGQESLASAMGEINPNNGISSRDPNGHPMAPCSNCSQTIPSLFNLGGMVPPPNVIAPGHPPQTIAALERQGIQPANPAYPTPTQRFTPPQNSTPSYPDRLRAHNAMTGDNRVVHNHTPGGGWTAAPP